MSPPSSKKNDLGVGDDEKKKARQLLNRSNQILKEVDESYIVSDPDHSVRLLPAFHYGEISLGPLLGTGGFCDVYEIEQFHILNTTTDETTTAKKETENHALAEKQETTPSILAINGGTTICVEEAAPVTAATKQDKVPANKTNNNSDINHEHSPAEEDILNFQFLDDHVHYDIRHAKELISKRPRRGNRPRYALKRLRTSLSPLGEARGMIDLAIELKFLSLVWHPNIIKIRAFATGDNIVRNDFFIILDCLQCTLDHKIKLWEKVHNEHAGKFMGLVGRNKEVIRSLMVTRLTVAYDLACAFSYMHRHQLVYRDIKPENIGFDFRGDVKVFDFGLCKGLSPKLKAKKGEYGFKLTGRVGSLPYMAPEVARMQTYDCKCDVFSFSILLWEILSIKKAFKGMSPKAFIYRVYTEQERLPISRSWPALTRQMLAEAWDDSPEQRPDMSQVAVMIRSDLNMMTTDETILHRTRHLFNRSQHSFNLGSSQHSQEGKTVGHDQSSTASAPKKL